MNKYVILLLVSLTASSSLATTNPCPDILGIYFDESADTNCSNQIFFTPFSVYVVITNPSSDSVFSVEFGYTVVPSVPGSLFRASTVLPPGATNIGDSSDVLTGSYILGIETPIPGNGQNVTVVTWSFMLLADMTVSCQLK